MAKIKRLGVIKASLFMGIYGVFIGLIVAIFFLVLASVLSSLIASIPGAETSIINNKISWLALLWMPALYGIGFFITGLIFIPITNLILKIIKGIDFDLEIEQATLPQQIQTQQRMQPTQMQAQQQMPQQSFY